MTQRHTEISTIVMTPEDIELERQEKEKRYLNEGGGRSRQISQ